MSYRLDLDEYEEIDLHREIIRRCDVRKQGLCDYCGRGVESEPSCKFPARHCPRSSRPRGQS